MQGLNMTPLEFSAEIREFFNPESTITYRFEDILDGASDDPLLDALKGAVIEVFRYYSGGDKSALVTPMVKAWLLALARKLEIFDDYSFVYDLIIKGLEAEARVKPTDTL